MTEKVKVRADESNSRIRPYNASPDGQWNGG